MARALAVVVIMLGAALGWRLLAPHLALGPGAAALVAAFAAGLVLAAAAAPLARRAPVALRLIAFGLVAGIGWAALIDALSDSPRLGSAPRREGPAALVVPRAWDGRLRLVGEAQGRELALVLTPGRAETLVPWGAALGLGLIAPGARADAAVRLAGREEPARKVTLPPLHIGPLRLPALPAYAIDRPGLSDVLLGAGALAHLGRIEIGPDGARLLPPQGAVSQPAASNSSGRK